MTEAEWLAGIDPEPMLSFIHKTANDRKLRLLACGFCETYKSYLTDWRLSNAIETAYRVADGVARERERNRVFSRAHQDFWDYTGNGESAVATYACGNREQMMEVPSIAMRAFAFNIYQNPRIMACLLLRDIFEPFRSPSNNPEWLTSSVLALARQMYDSRDFSAMPILADALQDAGCNNEDVLSHCRGPTPHVRGCWVVDRLLAKH
jgi:hypothetical protein